MAAATVVLVGVGVTGWVHAYQANGSRIPSAQSCITADDAFLKPADIGAFVKFVDQTRTVSPFFGVNRTGRLSQGFRRLRFIGLLANRALTGPSRAATDERSRGLRYTVGKWPQVPLVGPVVRGNPGVLEVYQSNWAFGSNSAASAYIQQVRATQGGDGDSGQYETVPVQYGDESYAYTVVPSSQSQETIANAFVRKGASVLTVRLQGGRHVSGRVLQPLVRTALSRVERSCSSHT